MTINIPDDLWNLLEDEAPHFNKENPETGIPTSKKHTPESLAVMILGNLLFASREGLQYTFCSAFYKGNHKIEVLNYEPVQDEDRQTIREANK